MKYETIRVNDSPTIKILSLPYATAFWAGNWKELLVDQDGTQYGTYDETGSIYPETLRLLDKYQIRTQSNWAQLLWDMAGTGQISLNDKPLRQFWTLESASKELSSFVSPVSENGYAGEIIVLKDDTDKIAGFTAFTTTLDPQLGRTLAQKRFPYQKLFVASTEQEEDVSLEQLLERLFPNQSVGTFLDFAISEDQRNAKLGSSLFDLRLARMVQIGFDVIVGRTIKTSPAQFYGNYLCRGMMPIAIDPDNQDKMIFAVQVNKLWPRQ